MQDILKKLGIKDKNSGTWSGVAGWSSRTEGQLIDSINPSTGEVIASVYSATKDDYADVIASSFEAYQVWRKTPAPLRGEAIRLCGEALRKYKDELGSLVALEMGKIKQEGDGEVQEMIDIADFAVGQSRMLYGYTMHSERPDHRMSNGIHSVLLVLFLHLTSLLLCGLGIPS